MFHIEIKPFGDMLCATGKYTRPPSQYSLFV